MVNALVDYLNAPGVVPLQRVVDNFSGDTLNERWTYTDYNGSNTGSMDDAVGGGYKIVTGTTNGNNAGISFNDISQYSNTSSTLIAVTKHTATSSFFHEIGFKENPVAGGTVSFAFAKGDVSITSNYFLSSNDGTTATNTIGSVAFTTSFQTKEINILSTHLTLRLDGTLDVVKTDRLPDATQEPYFRQGTRTNVSKVGHIKYLEAWNK
ncbi:MAG: hypothetical protein OES34_09565 [Nitrosopumilus sp.]|nr:hypothetical protein [Nitrosopumilus sp.]